MSRKPKCYCTNVNASSVKIGGDIQTTQIINDHKQGVESVLYTFYLTIVNNSGHELNRVGLYLDVRTVQKRGKKTKVVTGFGDSLKKNDVQVLLSSSAGVCDCENEKDKDFVGSGRFICLPVLKPGRTVVTVVMNVHSECVGNYTLLPSLFGLKLKKCCGDTSSFSTSVLIGCQAPTATCSSCSYEKSSSCSFSSSELENDH